MRQRRSPQARELAAPRQNHSLLCLLSVAPGWMPAPPGRKGVERARRARRRRFYGTAGVSRRWNMPVHLADSLIYQNSWGTDELRALFDDVPRTRSWLEILAVLAETQAEFDVIPRDAAQLVASTCRTIELDEAFFEEVRLDFEATNHSTLGLIRAVQRRCPGASGEWLYYAATVQDITDPWMAIVLQRVRRSA